MTEEYSYPPFPFKETKDSYEYVSMFPEQSAEKWRGDYEYYINKIIEEGEKAGLSHEEIQKLIDMFVNRYLKYIHELNSIRSRMVSGHVVGYAKYPAARMRKIAERLDKKERELDAFIDKFFKRIIPKFIKRKEIEEAGGEVEYLKKELEELKKAHEIMKKANKIVRSNLPEEEKEKKLKEIGAYWVEKEYGYRLYFPEPDYMGRLGFPYYELESIRNRIKRIEENIEKAKEKEEKKGEVEVSANYPQYGFKIVKDYGKDRVMIYFTKIPPEDLRTQLKKHGFRWSPHWKAWVRKLTKNAVYDARKILFEYYGIHRPASEEVEERTKEYVEARKKEEEEKVCILISIEAKTKDLRMFDVVAMDKERHSVSVEIPYGDLITMIRRGLFEEENMMCIVPEYFALYGAEVLEWIQRELKKHMTIKEVICKFIDTDRKQYIRVEIHGNKDGRYVEIVIHYGKEKYASIDIGNKREIYEGDLGDILRSIIDRLSREEVREEEVKMEKEKRECENRDGIWIEEFRECALYDRRFNVYIGEKTKNYYNRNGEIIPPEELKKILCVALPMEIYEFSMIFLNHEIISKLYDESCMESIKEGGTPDEIKERTIRLYYEKFSKMVFNRVSAILPEVVDNTYELYNTIRTLPEEYATQFKARYLNLIRKAVQKNEIPVEMINFTFIVEEFKRVIQSKVGEYKIKIEYINPEEVRFYIPELDLHTYIDINHGADDVFNEFLTKKHPALNIELPDVILLSVYYTKIASKLTVESDKIYFVDEAHIFYVEQDMETKIELPVKVQLKYSDLRAIGYKVGDTVVLYGKAGEYFIKNSRTGKEVHVEAIEKGVKHVTLKNIMGDSKIAMIPLGEELKHIKKVYYLTDTLIFHKSGDTLYYGGIGEHIIQGKISTFKDITGDPEWEVYYPCEYMVGIYQLSKYIELYMYIQHDRPLVIVDTKEYDMAEGKPIPKGESIRIYLAPRIKE